ncbi:MAG: hypothetical protein GY696_26005 [Gammaproteobacteria bacterium]|nr:hypothetical protein [Gammaproteobacteria bacterium]
MAHLTGSPLRMETEVGKDLEIGMSGLDPKKRHTTHQTTEAQQKGIEAGRDPDRDPVSSLRRES